MYARGLLEADLRTNNGLVDVPNTSSFRITDNKRVDTILKTVAIAVVVGLVVGLLVNAEAAVFLSLTAGALAYLILINFDDDPKVTRSNPQPSLGGQPRGYQVPGYQAPSHYPSTYPESPYSTRGYSNPSVPTLLPPAKLE